MDSRSPRWIGVLWLAFAACSGSSQNTPAMLAGGQVGAQAGVPGSGGSAGRGGTDVAPPMAAAGMPAVVAAGSGGAGAPALA
ncbi:MAG TPA: hypothetical protein VJV78_49755, partial [Polyangiales bacterium]|nr:hypothetical protein [Polyangiales bacterium]